jgi:hypothetical protein
LNGYDLFYGPPLSRFGDPDAKKTEFQQIDEMLFETDESAGDGPESDDDYSAITADVEALEKFYARDEEDDDPEVELTLFERQIRDADHSDVRVGLSRFRDRTIESAPATLRAVIADQDSSHV